MGFFDRFRKKDGQQTEQVTKNEEVKPQATTTSEDGGDGFEDSQPKD